MRTRHAILAGLVSLASAGAAEAAGHACLVQGEMVMMQGSEEFMRTSLHKCLQPKGTAPAVIAATRKECDGFANMAAEEGFSRSTVSVTWVDKCPAGATLACDGPDGKPWINFVYDPKGNVPVMTSFCEGSGGKVIPSP